LNFKTLVLPCMHAPADPQPQEEPEQLQPQQLVVQDDLDQLLGVLPTGLGEALISHPQRSALIEVGGRLQHASFTISVLSCRAKGIGLLAVVLVEGWIFRPPASKLGKLGGSLGMIWQTIATLCPSALPLKSHSLQISLCLLLQVVLDLGRRPEARFQGATAEFVREEPVSAMPGACQA
jgi:hypothetical protein